eukprot:SAG11_NODE_30624_length_299_cov_0.775000_1_plen_24_part_01
MGLRLCNYRGFWYDPAKLFWRAQA